MRIGTIASVLCAGAACGLVASVSAHDHIHNPHEHAGVVDNDRRVVLSTNNGVSEHVHHASLHARGQNSSTTPAHNLATEDKCDSKISPKNGNFVVAGYWPDWAGDDMTPSKIAYDKYDMIYYAFGIPSESGQISLDAGSDTLLKQLVSNAHSHGTKVVLSVGGWSDSKYFSSLVASTTSRENFVSALKSYVDKYNIDGIDIDWEYPNDSGAGSNEKNPDDTRNFQTFFQDLRRHLPNAILSAATTQSPWTASSGNPVSSVARAAGALDFIFVMNYDVWGSGSKPGPNAPLADLCGKSDQPDASAAAAVAAWTNAGMPREKILMGMPMYGYVSKSSATQLRQRAVADEGSGAHHSHRKPSQSQIENQRSLLHPGQGASFKQSALSEGQNNFNVLVAQGYLIKEANGNFKAESGWTLERDQCSDTPFMYNHKQVITYDDPLSIYEKSVFTALAGLGGLGFWSIEADTSDHDLVNAAIKGLQLKPF